MRSIQKRFIVSLFCFLMGGVPYAEATHNKAYLRVHVESEPSSLDIARATGLREFEIIQSIYEGLTRFHPSTLKPLPAVAKDWKISADGLVYTFHLRSDAKWNDGTPVTADDFWLAWERMLNPKTKAEYASAFFYIKNGESYSNGTIHDPKMLGMKVLDPHTLQVTLEQPTPYFLYLTSFGVMYPVHEKTLQKYNGPFVLYSWSPNKEMVLLPNPYYWGKSEVRLPGVECRFLSNFELALEHYDAKSIDVLADLPPNRVSILKWRPDFYNSPLIRTEYFTLNVKRAPLSDPRVREALSLAIDREAIVRKVLQRGDVAYGTLVPPGIPVYHAPANRQDFNPERAKALLQAAGFKDPAQFPVLEILYNNATDRLLVAQAAAAMWQKVLGIRTKLRGEEWNDYLETRTKKNFMISWGGWYGDYLDPNTFLELFEGKNAQNYSNWSNAQYDALMQKARKTTDIPLRMALFQQAEAILVNEIPVMPVLVKSKNYLMQPYVSGYYSNLLDNHPFRDIRMLDR